MNKKFEEKTKQLCKEFWNSVKTIPEYAVQFKPSDTAQATRVTIKRDFEQVLESKNEAKNS